MRAVVEADTRDDTGVIHRRPYRLRQTSEDMNTVRQARRFRKRSVTFNIPLKASHAMLDRMKLSLPMITVSASLPPQALFDELQRRASGSRWAPIRVSRAAPTKIFIDFHRKDWLFALSITLRVADGRWSGAGSLELNGMRLFGYIAANRDPIGDREVHPIDLVCPKGQQVHPGTLDGNDNFIASAYMPDALERGWSDFGQRYIEAIVKVFDDVFGRTDGLQSAHAGLLGFPPFGEWVWREIEVCHEYGESDAVSISEQFRKLTLSLVSEHQSTNYGRKNNPLQKEMKSANLHSSTTQLTKSIDLVCYAKALDRFRVEIRYYPNILKSIRTTRSELPTTSRAVGSLLERLCEDATRRINKAISECLTRMEGVGPNMQSVSVALALVASVCGDDSTIIHRFVSAFIQGQGIAPFPGSESAIDALIEEGVLVESRLKLRSPQPQYVLDERFRNSFRALQSALANMGTDTLDAQ